MLRRFVRLFSATKLSLPSASIVPRLVTGVLLVDLFFVSMAIVSLRESKHHYQEAAATATRSLAKISQLHLGDVLNATNLALVTMIDELGRQGASGNINRLAIDSYIARLHRLNPSLTGLRITDSQGRIAYGDQVAPESQISIADRDYFIKLRDNPDAGFVIGKPALSRVSGKWVLICARRLNRLDGSFDGIVYSWIDLEQLNARFAELDIGSHGVVTVFGKDLKIIARHFDDQEISKGIGQELQSTELRQMLRSAKTIGTFDARSAIDNAERKCSFHQVSDYPLYVAVGLASNDYLAEWTKRAFRTAVLAALFLLVTWVIAWIIYRGWRQRRAFVDDLTSAKRAADLSAKKILQGKIELDETVNELSSILSNVSVGICIVKPMPDGRRILRRVNPAMERMLGYEPGELIGLDTRVLAMEAADYEAIGATYAEAINLGKTYQGDLPFRRKDGEGILCSMRGSALDPKDLSKGGVWLLEDITERVRMQMELARQTKLLKDGADNQPGMLVIWDSDLRFVYWSQRAEAYLDLPPGTLYEGLPYQNILRLFAERGDFGPGEVEALVEDRMQSLLKRESG